MHTAYFIRNLMTLNMKEASKSKHTAMVIMFVKKIIHYKHVTLYN